jgi:hypothetical protein
MYPDVSSLHHYYVFLTYPLLALISSRVCHDFYYINLHVELHSTDCCNSALFGMSESSDPPFFSSGIAPQRELKKRK